MYLFLIFMFRHILCIRYVYVVSMASVLQRNAVLFTLLCTLNEKNYNRFYLKYFKFVYM